MTGPIRELDRLLAGLAPELDPATYVFAVASGPVPAGVEPLMTFTEREGLTLVVERGAAERAELAGRFTARRITLTVHSALDAVGLTAAVAARLAAAGIACNMAAGVHHDHLFVPEADADAALAALVTPSARDALLAAAIDGYFGRVAARDLPAVLAGMAPDCVMRVATSGYTYAGRDAIAAHFADFFAHFPGVAFADLQPTADPVGGTVAVRFAVTLDDGRAPVTLDNCNFFTAGPDGRWTGIVIYTSAPVRAGFEAGAS